MFKTKGQTNNKTNIQWREAFGSWLYAALNFGFALSVLIAITIFSSPLAAFIILCLSKWRVFAVKPRFWWANIQSNAVDFIVGMSYIIWLLQAPNNISNVILLLVGYIVWLLLIKPSSNKILVSAQGLVALFFGLSSILMLGYEWNSILLVALELVVVLVSLRHILSIYANESLNYYAIVWALFNLELLWLLNFWVIAYPITWLGFYLVQAALVVLLVNLVACILINKLVTSKQEAVVEARLSRAEILPILFSALVIIVLLLFLSQPLIGGI